MGYSASSSSASDGTAGLSFSGAGVSYGGGARIFNLGGSGVADFKSNATAAAPNGAGAGSTSNVLIWAAIAVVAVVALMR